MTNRAAMQVGGFRSTLAEATPVIDRPDEEMTGRRSTVSVVMSVCNNARFLVQAVESIAAQSLQPDELIVGDDGSNDGSSIVLARLASAYPFLKVLRRHR